MRIKGRTINTEDLAHIGVFGSVPGHRRVSRKHTHIQYIGSEVIEIPHGVYIRITKFVITATYITYTL